MAEQQGTPPPRPRRRWHRLPTRFQVVLGLGSLLALLVASMLIAVALVLAFKVEQRPLNERDAQYANSVAEAALNAKGVANDQRGFLLSGDPMFIHEADRRIRDVRTNFAAAITAAASPTQRQAVNDARIGFERWVQTMQGEFTSFQAGDRQRAIAASLGPDRTLRKTYEQSLASAQALDAFSTRSSTRSSAATSSRWSWILFAGLVAALSIGVGVAFRDDLS